MPSSIFDKLENNAKKHPDKPAYIYSHKGIWKNITYSQLLDLTNRFASGLQACQLTPNMRAVVMTPPGMEFFPFAFALLKLGIIPVIADPAIGLKKLGACIDESQPDIFIGNALTHALRIIFGWGKKTIRHNLTIQSVKNQSSKFERPTPISQLSFPDSSAAIIFTSGSTGIPKGALYTQENFSAQLDMLAQTFNIDQNEIDLPAFPLYALIDSLLGVTSIIPDSAFPLPAKTNPKKVLEAIQKFNVTNMFASPIVLDILSNYGIQNNVNLPSLKRVITAGAPASMQLQKKFRKLLDNKTNLFGIYGATEVLPIAKIESREIFELGNKTANGAGVCLGRPVDGVAVRVIPITDEPINEWQDSLQVESNVVGEITVQGPAVTRAYIHGKDANHLSKIRNGGHVIHRMGDVGYFDEQGSLWYCGRKSQRVTVNDDTVFTEQIENIFNAHPLVYRTALVGVNKKPVLWVELKNSARADRDKIRRDFVEMGRRHPQASQIETFLFIKKFPTDVRHNSKIIREELTMLAEKRLK